MKVKIPIGLQRKLRGRISKLHIKTLVKIDDDVWVGQNKIARHRDSTAKGKDTILCMLYVEGKYLFKQWIPMDEKRANGTNKEQLIYTDLDIGKIIRFDARIFHEAYLMPGTFGKFAAIMET